MTWSRSTIHRCKRLSGTCEVGHGAADRKESGLLVSLILLGLPFLFASLVRPIQKIVGLRMWFRPFERKHGWHGAPLHAGQGRQSGAPEDDDQKRCVFGKTFVRLWRSFSNCLRYCSGMGFCGKYGAELISWEPKMSFPIISANRKCGSAFYGNICLTRRGTLLT
uniref:Uncharacterized protein n=1 Tax=Salix viminalis TaxID=40686 RepID=A0A6N2NDU0_SALVM